MPTELRPDRNGVSLSFATDRRYRLIARLEAAASGQPLDDVTEWLGAIRISSSEPLGFYSGKAPPPLRHEVHVTFDRQMPLRAVYRALQQAWPKLRKQGVVRATRPLGARTLALIEHVCIKMPTSSWAERWEAWNARHRQWHVEPRQAFIAEFHVAERSLTGRRHGLAYWYEPNARLTMPRLAELAREGNAGAKRELDRRIADGIATLPRGLQVVREPATPTTRARGRASSTRSKNAKGGQHGKTKR